MDFEDAVSVHLQHLSRSSTLRCLFGFIFVWMLYTKDCTAKSILVKFLGTSACVFTENVFAQLGTYSQ